MKIIGEEVECVNRITIPTEDETIADDFEIDKMAPLIVEIKIYLRETDMCPFNRGNWLIDLRFINGRLFSIKLPKEMEKYSVIRFAKPLIDLLEKNKKSKEH